MSKLRGVGLDAHLRYVGLDVHKDTIVIAVAEEGQSEAVALGAFPHDVAKLVKRLVKLEVDVSRLRVCYEAGPTGFGLCRRLAHFLRSGDLTAVWALDEQTEALRDLECSRDAAKNAERVARHQLDLEQNKPRNKAIAAVARKSDARL